MAISRLEFGADRVGDDRPVAGFFGDLATGATQPTRALVALTAGADSLRTTVAFGRCAVDPDAAADRFLARRAFGGDGLRSFPVSMTLVSVT